MASLEDIKKEYQEIIDQLSDPELVSDSPASNASGVANAGWDKFEEVSKRKKELDKIIEKQTELEDTQKRIKESQSMILSEEPELADLAQSEITELKEKEKKLIKEVLALINNEGSSGPSYSAIIEIRAGAGGNEAALFASDLYKMYSRYAESRSWQIKLLDSHAIGIGGYKEIIFEIKGNAFNELKNEAGVHRVQRIPETEKMGRIHTSTASVAVLPKPQKTEIKIRTDELKIDVFKSSGPGGQNVNKRETAVRITHLPTGTVVTSHTERNQLQNKENALAILSARLLEKKEEERARTLGGKRKEQIGKAMRAEKIRTYNFPQDRVTDHRIKKSWHGIEEIMSGNLNKIVETLQKELK